jgi:ATP-binding cassette subfamily B protein
MFVAILQIRSNEHIIEGLKQVNEMPSRGASFPVEFKKEISLTNVSFHFKGKRPCLKNINLSVSRGERIALVGPSGSGKTTLLLVVMRFLREQEGKVCIDNVVLTDSHIESWRTNLAYVPQDPVIFDGTIIENIIFGADQSADRETILRLITILGLGPWVQGLAEGLDTKVGERGAKISGGQRQRIAIARALCRRAPVILLDEATSQVDAVTEQEVLQAVHVAGSPTQTLIMVTHRNPSLSFFDRVIEVSEGQVKELQFK